MRALLVHPDFPRPAISADAMRASFNPPALGINLLAAVLKSRGHEVDVLDALRLVTRYGPSHTTSFEDAVGRFVAGHTVDLVGFNVTSPTRLIAVKCARAAKHANPQTHVVFGGPHATIVGHQLIDRYPGLIDAVVCGEAEESLPRLMESISGEKTYKSIAGVITRTVDGSQTSPLQGLDEYPPPDYGAYRTDPQHSLFDTVPVMTARGCPYHCSFCYSQHFWNGHVRHRATAQLLDEIQHALTHLGCTKVHFNDDLFSVPLARAKSILSGMVTRGLQATIYCNTRIDCLDEELLALYEAAGGGCIYFGIESGSERLRNSMNKRLSNTAIEAGIALLRQHPSIRVGVFLMLGYPGQRQSDIDDTERLLQNISPNEVTCNIVHVHPGTALFDLAVRDGIYEADHWLSEEQDFFPYERDLAKLHRLHEVCRRIEAHYGRPVQRSSLIRDVGSI